MSWAKAADYLKREYGLRPVPHGLLGWRYLLPTQDTRLQQHRQWWWHYPRRLPRWLWLLLELWLWLRWVGYGAWRASWRTVHRLGPSVAAREGLSLTRQGLHTLRLALGWCIPPLDVYRFKLYRQPELALDYVYDHELPSYHRWRNMARSLTQASLSLLQDKQQQAMVLATDGVPTVRALACLPRNARAKITDWLGADSVLFCKTRSGSRGQGAMTVWASPQGIRGRMLDGLHLENPAAVEKAWQALLALDDVLVQERLSNHPALVPLAAGEDAITVRFISQWRGEQLACYSATLEIPAGHSDKNGHPWYVILPIVAHSGCLQDFPEDGLKTEQARTQLQRIRALWRSEAPLPHWDDLVSASYRAHQRFPDIWGIAWDWVITPEGPRLLEGNSGWGTATPQMLNGGLLARNSAE